MAQNSNQGQSRQGTGSAEQTGRARSDQQLQTDLNKGERKDIAQQAEVGQDQIATQRDLGADSGRDDYAGGSGDVMDDQDTGQRTDR